MSPELPADDDLARRLCERKSFNGRPLAPGDFVAVAGGRVVGVGSTFEEADAWLAASALPEGDGIVCQIGNAEADMIRRGS